MTKILIIGGYGALGARIAITLAYEEDLHLLIAGRHLPRAEALVDQMKKHRPQSKVRSAEVDAGAETIGKALSRHKPDLVIHAAPVEDHAAAAACIERGIHYLDLDSDRKRVAAIAELDKEARKAKVLCVAGAGLVTGVTSAVADHLCARFGKVACMEYGCNFGNQSGFGPASFRRLLADAGRDIDIWDQGEWRYEYGWHPVFEQVIPSLGLRRFGSIDTPDSDLFRQRFEGVGTVRAYAGLSPPGAHAALWGLSWLVRWKLTDNLPSQCARLQQVAQRLYRRRDDRMGLYFHVEGKESARKELALRWQLVARGGDGPQVAVMPAVLIARRLAAGEMKTKGAMACQGLVTLEEILAELAEFQVEVSEA